MKFVRKCDSYIVPNSEQNPEECDATDDDSSNAVGLIKRKNMSHINQAS